MKKNKIALVIVIILGALSFWFISNKHNGTIKETLRDFAVADTASINKIFLADKKGNTILLERSSNGRWTVNGKYEARIDVVKTLLLTIKKIAVKEPIGKNAIDNVVKRLASKAVKCEIYQNNKLFKAYYVGSETQDATGTYMIMIDPETMQTSAKPFITYIPGFEGYLTSRYFTEEAGWRDRTIYHYKPNEIKSIRLEVMNSPEKGFELIIKGNNNYEVHSLNFSQPILNLEAMSVKQYLSYFQQVNFESFEVSITQKQIDSTLKTSPIKILTIKDSKGNTNKTSFFARWPRRHGLFGADGKEIIYDTDRLDALMTNGKDFVMCQYYVFGKLFPEIEYFKKRRD